MNVYIQIVLIEFASKTYRKPCDKGQEVDTGTMSCLEIMPSVTMDISSLRFSNALFVTDKELPFNKNSLDKVGGGGVYITSQVL